MIGWIILIVLGIMIVTVLNISHLRHRITLALLILLAVFLVLSVNLVYTKNPIDLKTTAGVVNAVKIYFGWLANGFHNLKTITGNVVKMDWTSTNSTFFNKSTFIDAKKI